MGISEISSDSLVARFSEQGAELVELKLRGQNHNWIWSGKDVWTRSAPLLFPIVGKLLEDSYLYHEKQYKLQQHGFARDMKFDLVYLDASSIVFELTESRKTLSVYPFKFKLIVKYKVVNRSLIMNVQVLNTDIKESYFSFGWHPAFVFPKQQDISGLNFTADRPWGAAYFLRNGLLSFEKKILFGRNISLDEYRAEKDAWIFSENNCDEIRISDRDGNILKVDTGGSSSLGIWTKDPSKFLCIEPWWGYPDLENTSSLLEQKAGIIKIEPGNKWNVDMSVTIE